MLGSAGVAGLVVPRVFDPSIKYLSFVPFSAAAVLYSKEALTNADGHLCIPGRKEIWKEIHQNALQRVVGLLILIFLTLFYNVRMFKTEFYKGAGEPGVGGGVDT